MLTDMRRQYFSHPLHQPDTASGRSNRLGACSLGRSGIGCARASNSTLRRGLIACIAATPADLSCTHTAIFHSFPSCSLNRLGRMAWIGDGAGAATTEGALVQVYQNNPQLNSQRGATRAAGQNVPHCAFELSAARDWDRDPDRAVC